MIVYAQGFDEQSDGMYRDENWAKKKFSHVGLLPLPAAFF